MRKVTLTITAIFLSTLLIACASQDTIKKGQADAKKPVNCATAEADIRVLQSEKTHADQQMAAGVSAIVPAGQKPYSFLGVLTHLGMMYVQNE